MSHQKALTDYLSAFISSLIESGVEDVVISPGSRSTPLAILLSEHRRMNVYMNIDERSAGFFALGLAKASGKPAALLCTSGTAAANYFPAVVEANLSRVPLIVLTADRPHELRDTGAPQAIDQVHLYGRHVHWFADLALPEAGQERYASYAASRAVAEALSLPKGPVHVNFPLREPLMPLIDEDPYLNHPVSPAVESGRLQLPIERIGALAVEWQQVGRGLIICGPIEEEGFSQAVKALSKKLGFPIIADPLSQLRSGASEDEFVIDSYDAILKSEGSWTGLRPECILRFGGMPVSKPLTLFLKKMGTADHVVIDGGAGWRDPYQLNTRMIQADETLFCERLAGMLEEKGETEWVQLWKKADSIAKEAVAVTMSEEEELIEGRAIYELAELLPEESTIFVGNSMPIRDMDTFFHQTGKNIRVMGNRGANGIDGVVSTALGASVHSRPLYLVIGDLSFFHDMNGLLAAKMHRLNMTVILLNNDGGGIFSYLSQADEPKHFEVLFGTPTGLNFEHAAMLYQAQYTKVLDWEGYRMAVRDAGENDGLTIIEVPTDRGENLASHRKMWDRISRGINKFLQEEQR